MNYRRAVLLICLLLLARCTAPSSPPSATEATVDAKKKVTVLFGANRQGEVDPCGCQLNQLGGLERLANLVLKKRTEAQARPFLFVDAGDTFFASSELNPSRVKEAQSKARTIAKSYGLMEVAALLPGDRDFAQGLEFLKDLEKLSGARFVASNLTDDGGNLLFAENTIWEKDGVRVGIFGVASEEAFARVAGVKVLPWKEAATRQVEKLREQKVDFIVALSHLGLTSDRELGTVAEIDLIAGSHSQDVTSVPTRVGKVTIVQPHPQGHQVGLVTLHSPERVISSFSLVDLGTDYDGKNQVTAMIDELRREIGSAAIAGLSDHYQATTERPFVAHATTCRGCHRAQYDFWAKTKHSSAYLVLFSKNQHFNPECIGCHSLGFQQPGGFEAIAKPVQVKPGKNDKGPFIESWMKLVFAEEIKKGPLDSRLQKERHAKLHRNYQRELMKLEAQKRVGKWYIGVQCEHCHGNRNGHPAGNVETVKKVTETACKQCHIPPNAPNFDPATIKQVACPLMTSKAGSASKR